MKIYCTMPLNRFSGRDLREYPWMEYQKKRKVL